MLSVCINWLHNTEIGTYYSLLFRQHCDSSFEIIYLFFLHVGASPVYRISTPFYFQLRQLSQELYICSLLGYNRRVDPSLNLICSASFWCFQLISLSTWFRFASLAALARCIGLTVKWLDYYYVNCCVWLVFCYVLFVVSDWRSAKYVSVGCSIKVV